MAGVAPPRGQAGVLTPVNGVGAAMSGLVGVVAIQTQFIPTLTILYAGCNYPDMPPRPCTLVRRQFAPDFTQFRFPNDSRKSTPP
jgi:hypothetical protein